MIPSAQQLPAVGAFIFGITLERSPRETESAKPTTRAGIGGLGGPAAGVVFAAPRARPVALVLNEEDKTLIGIAGHTDNPGVDNRAAERRQLNRRVELMLVPLA